MSDMYGSETERINNLIDSNKQLSTDNLSTLLSDEQQQNVSNWKEKADEFAQKYSALAEGGGTEIAASLGLEGAYSATRRIKGLYGKVKERRSAMDAKKAQDAENSLNQESNLNADPEGFPSEQVARSETSDLRSSLMDRFNQAGDKTDIDNLSNVENESLPAPSEAQGQVIQRPPPARDATIYEDDDEIQPAPVESAEQSGSSFYSSALSPEEQLRRTVSAQNIGDLTVRTNKVPFDIAGQELSSKNPISQIVSTDPRTNPFVDVNTQSGSNALVTGQQVGEQSLNEGRGFVQTQLDNLASRGANIRQGVQQGVQNIKNSVTGAGEDLGQQVGEQLGKTVAQSGGEELAGMAIGDAVLGAVPVFGELALGVTGLVSIGEGLYHLFHHSHKPPPAPALPQMQLNISNPNAGLTQKFASSLPSIDTSAEPSASSMSF